MEFPPFSLRCDFPPPLILFLSVPSISIVALEEEEHLLRSAILMSNMPLLSFTYSCVTFSSQAEFSEINLVANSQGAYSVTVDAIRNGHKVNKYVLCSMAVLNVNMCRVYKMSTGGQSLYFIYNNPFLWMLPVANSF